MQIRVDKKESSQLTFEVEVPKETVNKVFSEAFKKVAKEVHISGFRKGKAPRKIFEQKYGKEPIEEEAIKDLYAIVYNQILEEKKINPVTYPRVEVVKFSENEPAVLKIEIAIKPDVKLGNYKGVKVKSKKIKTEDEEVNQSLKNLQKAHAEYPPLLENRPTQEGDWLALEIQPSATDFVSLKPKKENIWYKLGSDQLPPSFHQKLLGSKIGDEKIIETVIPPDHPRKELAGKKINLNVKVKDIRKERLPELNDEFAKKLNFENMDSLKNHIRKEIGRMKERKEEERIKVEIVGKVVKSSKVDPPPFLIQEGVEEKRRKFEEELRKNNIDKASFLKEQNLTEEELNKRFTEQVELELKTIFVLDKIAEKEKIEVTEDEIDERLRLFIQGDNKEVKVKQLKERLIKEGRLGSLIQRIRNEKTIDFLYKHAEVSEGILSSLK